MSPCYLATYIRLIKSLHNYSDQLQTKKSGFTEIYFTTILWPKDKIYSSDDQVFFVWLIAGPLSSERSTYVYGYGTTGGCNSAVLVSQDI